MTVSSTSGHQLTIGEHVQLAYQTLGVLEASQEPSAADYTLGKRHLQNLVNGLERRGIMASAVQIVALQLVAEQAEYDLPAGIDEFFATGMYASPGDDGNGQTQVIPATREEYQTLGVKGSPGRPTRYWCNRETRQVSIWLKPDEAGIVTFQARRKLADTTDNAATLDLEQYWDEWILAALCQKLAPAKSQWDKAPYFAAEAASLFDACMGRATESKADEVYLDHGVKVG